MRVQQFLSNSMHVFLLAVQRQTKNKHCVTHGSGGKMSAKADHKQQQQQKSVLTMNSLCSGCVSTYTDRYTSTE